jgi:hypothetical protein
VGLLQSTVAALLCGCRSLYAVAQWSRERVEDDPALLADLTYEAELLEKGRVPGVGDKGRLRATTELVRQLKQRMPDMAILPAHDPGAARRLHRASASSG